ncbi:MAG: hypothetical protein M8353_03240 [ANME-2 cluster archaeon]|nr:hypothetical protein [ANME-2 cluster archaeon]
MIDMKVETGPTLTAGAFNVTFGQFEKVSEAVVVMDGPQVADYAFEVLTSIATNVVTVTVKKMQISAVNTWGNAVTADVAAKKFTVVAKGL